MSEAIRTCKRCGRQYTGYHCNSVTCRAARQKRNADARRRRSGGGGVRRMRRYTAWGTASDGFLVMPVGVYPEACPKVDNDPAS
jgi:hypothetical protein